MVNQKSDVPAKTAFIAELLSRGYSNARVTKRPADITAEKDGETYFFEIKSTSAEKSYFGAATLTEWRRQFATRTDTACCCHSPE